MPRRKKLKKVKEKIVVIEEKAKGFNEMITQIVSGLVFMSETDAEIFPFTGTKTDAVTKETLLAQLNKETTTNIEERDFNEFFEPLIKFKDWFKAEERKMTEKFIELKDLLQQNLINKKVFRLGKKEIDIFVVGLDRENILRGIQTKAVET